MGTLDLQLLQKIRNNTKCIFSKILLYRLLSVLSCAVNGVGVEPGNVGWEVAARYHRLAKPNPLLLVNTRFIGQGKAVPNQFAVISHFLKYFSKFTIIK